MNASLQAYLLWQQERGLVQPPYRPGVVATSAPMAASLTPPSPPPATAESPLQLAGAPTARLLCLCPAPHSAPAKLIEGPARELLLRMVQAMGLRPQTDIMLAALSHPVAPLGTPAVSGLGAALRHLPLRAALCLGEQAWNEFLTAAGSSSSHAGLSFAQAQHRWQRLSFLPDAVPVMPLYHPAEILAAEERKRTTWAALQEVIRHLEAP